MVLRNAFEYSNNYSFIGLKNISYYLAPYLYERLEISSLGSKLHKIIVQIPTYIYSRKGFFTTYYVDVDRIINNDILVVLVEEDRDDLLTLDKFYNNVILHINASSFKIKINCRNLEVAYFNPFQSPDIKIYTPGILQSLVTPGAINISYPNLSYCYYVTVEGIMFCIDSSECRTNILNKALKQLKIIQIHNVKDFIRDIDPGCEIFFGPWKPDPINDGIEAITREENFTYICKKL